MKETQKKSKQANVKVFSFEENQCIWMKAGVVNFKLCDNAFDCLSCPFDKAMSKGIEKKPEQVVSWREHLQKKPYNQRECRHMLSGKVQFRLCGNAYHCDTCEFDQSLEHQQTLFPLTHPHAVNVSGFQVADGYYYHRGHTWARVEHGGMIRIGVDDFSLRLLGNITEFKLPKLGSPLEQTNVGWSLKREEKAAPMLSPVEGIVVARNHKAIADPKLAKNDPYGEGWLLVVEPRKMKQSLKNLLFGEEANGWTKAEAKRLEDMVMSIYGMPMAATGGEVVDDIYGNVGHLDWNDLVHEFLLT